MDCPLSLYYQASPNFVWSAWQWQCSERGLSSRWSWGLSKIENPHVFGLALPRNVKNCQGNASAVFFSSKMCSLWLHILSEIHKLSWKCHNNWDTRQRTGPACLVAHSCHTWLCWFWHKTYWVQIWGQAEPDYISSAFGCQSTFSPSQGKRRTPVVSLPASYCVRD